MTKVLTPECEPPTSERYIANSDPVLPETAERWQKRRTYERDLRQWRERRKRHPIRSCSIKERPQCRACITKQALSPYPSADAWDGFSALIGFVGDNPSLPMRTFLSEGLRKQMHKMILEGSTKDSTTPQRSCSVLRLQWGEQSMQTDGRPRRCE